MIATYFITALVMLNVHPPLGWIQYTYPYTDKELCEKYIGEFKDGYLKITDRKKSLIVTSGGKNVAPAPIENALVNSPYIEQAVVIGDKRNFISALIVPTEEAVKKELNAQGKSVSGSDIMSDNPDVKALIQKEVDIAMAGFSNYERVKEFTILPRLFTIEDGELTPTLKVVRKVVLDNFSDSVEKIYSRSKKSSEQMEAGLL